MYDVVLFPTDGSEIATRAQEHAISHAQVYNASLHALYVTDT